MIVSDVARIDFDVALIASDNVALIASDNVALIASDAVMRCRT